MTPTACNLILLKYLLKSAEVMDIPTKNVTVSNQIIFQKMANVHYELVQALPMSAAWTQQPAHTAEIKLCNQYL